MHNQYYITSQYAHEHEHESTKLQEQEHKTTNAMSLRCRCPSLVDLKMQGGPDIPHLDE
jgi:hypothetical protein